MPTPDVFIPQSQRAPKIDYNPTSPPQSSAQPTALADATPPPSPSGGQATNAIPASQPSTPSPTAGGRLSLDQFGQKIKDKYPQYKNVSNTDLANKIIEKYPQYKDQISDMPSGTMAFLGSRNATQKQPGFLSRVWGDITKRAGDITETAKETQKKPWMLAGEAQLQAMGSAAGAVTDIATEGLKSVFHLLPQDLQDKAKQSVGGAMEALGIPQAMDKYQGWAAQHPEASKDLESAINIASLLPIGEAAGAAKTATEAAIKPVTEEAGKIAARVSEKIAPTMRPEIERMAAKAGIDAKDEAFQKALEITKPVYGPKGKQAALEAGRVKEVGVLRTPEVMPTQADIEAADAVKNIVTGNPAKDTKAINTEIARISEDQIRPTLEANNAIYNRKQLESALTERIKDAPGYAEDEMVKKAYDKAVRTLLQKADAQPGTVLGAHDARIAFDKAESTIFPRTGDQFRDTLGKQAMRDVRDAANDFIGSKLPDNVRTEFESARKLQSKMFHARNNIGKAGAKTLGKNAIKRLLESHPWLKKATEYGAAIYGLEEGKKLLGF